MQNVNTHLRWGGGQEGRGLGEQVMGRTDGGAERGGEWDEGGAEDLEGKGEIRRMDE